MLNTYVFSQKTFKLRRLKVNQTAVIKRTKPSPSLSSISRQDFLMVKKIIRRFPQLSKVVKSAESIYGLMNLNNLTNKIKFAKFIENWLKADIKIESFLITDLEKLGKLSSNELDNIQYRFKMINDNVNSLNLTPIKKLRVLNRILHSPETYFKFSRSIDCEKNGFTPSYFSEVLEKQGYSKQELNKLMSLIHLPSCCTTDEEWKFLMEARAKFEPIKEGVKVIHEKDVANYLNGPFDRIFGFVADEGLYQSRFNRADLALSILRLDYPKTIHFVNNTDKTYAIYFFGPEVGEKCIPPIQRELTVNSNGDVSINVPYSPNTGNAFTSARNNMIIPEFEISFKDPVLLQDAQLILGYFDNQGEFHPQHAYIQNKWVSVEYFFAIHEEIKRDTTERASTERNQTRLDVTNQLPKGQAEFKPKDISLDDFGR